jgi:hypothetical protein
VKSIGLIVVLLFLTLGSSWEARQQIQGPQKKLTWLQRLRESRSYRRCAAFVTVVLAFATAVQTVVAIFDPFWPTRPDVTFHDTIDASSLVLPFKVTNTNTLFPMDNLEILCGVDLFYFIDADRKTGIVRGMTFNPGPISIAPRSSTNFPCTASDYVTVTQDGSLMIGFGGQGMTTGPGVFRGPLTALKMCLWMSGRYEAFGYSIPFVTPIFQWPAAPGQRQWMEGPIAPDLPSAKWVPANSKLGGAWGMKQIVAPGWGDLRPDALQCTNPAS